MKATTNSAIIPPAAKTNGAIARRLKPEPMFVVVVVMVVLAAAVHPACEIAPPIDCQTLNPIGSMTARKIKPTMMPRAMPVMSPFRFFLKDRIVIGVRLMVNG
jgi:hypothetical protein